jgi:hypothetical protein
VVRVDQGGTRIKEFVGPRSFVYDLTRHGRRVRNFMVPVDGHGRTMQRRMTGG